MVSLYRDPLGENIFSTNNGQSSVANVSGGGALRILRNKDERTMALETRIKELEGLLRERRVSHRGIKVTLSHKNRSLYNNFIPCIRMERVLLKGERQAMPFLPIMTLNRLRGWIEE